MTSLVEPTDEQILAMSPRQRRDLIQRLARPSEELLPTRVVHRLRYLRLALMTGSALLLIPWIAYLSLTLPDRYVVHNWAATWIGFDILLLLMFATTALLGWLRRLLVVLPAFASGVLLVCDAWFDITLAGPHDVWGSVASAALELPVAVVLIGGTLRLMWFAAARMWLLEPGTRLWQVSIGGIGVRLP